MKLRLIALFLIFILTLTNAEGYSGIEDAYKIDLSIYASGVGGAYNEGGYSLYLVPGQALISYLCGITSSDPPCNRVPVADAGYDQTVHVGSVVTLDGSVSSDPDGNVPLSYKWSIISRPDGSTASLSGSSIVNPEFIPDIGGDYVVQLVVKDSLGAVSSPDTVKISTANSAPISDAGPDRSVIVIGTEIPLDGSQSYDIDGDPITYLWTFVSKPAGSSASLAGADTTSPAFVADMQGTYEIQLVVSDRWAQSSPDTVTVSFENLKPVADAGTSRSVVIGETAALDGSGCSDANGDTLTYSWTLISVPEGSTSVIDNPATEKTTFVPDSSGSYVVQLIVNDGIMDSDPDTIQVQAVTGETEVISAAQSLETTIASFNPDVFKNDNMQNTFLNKLNAVIENIEQGNYADASGQLQNDILAKIDGCTNSGAPDKNDWIKVCGSQEVIYPYILDLIAKVNSLL